MAHMTWRIWFILQGIIEISYIPKKNPSPSSNKTNKLAWHQFKPDKDVKLDNKKKKKKKREKKENGSTKIRSLTNQNNKSKIIPPIKGKTLHNN